MNDSGDGFWRAMEQWDRIEARRVQRRTAQRQTIASIRASLDQEYQLPQEAPLTPPSSATMPSPMQPPTVFEPFPMTTTQYLKNVRARIQRMVTR